MRSGLEKAVAVYSLSAVNPGRPQSHAGPRDAATPPAHGQRKRECRAGKQEEQSHPGCRYGAAMGRSRRQRQAVSRDQRRTCANAKSLLRDGIEDPHKPGGAETQRHASHRQNRHSGAHR